MASTSAGIARSPWLLQVRPHVCQCRLPARELGIFAKLDRAQATAAGYWNIISAFYGELQTLLWLDIVDRRDGTVVWRNGRPPVRRSNDQDQQALF